MDNMSTNLLVFCICYLSIKLLTYIEDELAQRNLTSLLDMFLVSLQHLMCSYVMGL